MLERDLPLNLNFYRHKPGSPLDLAAEEDALIAGMLAAYKVYEEVLPTRPFLNGLLDWFKQGGISTPVAWVCPILSLATRVPWRNVRCSSTIRSPEHWKATF